MTDNEYHGVAFDEDNGAREFGGWLLRGAARAFAVLLVVAAVGIVWVMV